MFCQEFFNKFFCPFFAFQNDNGRVDIDLFQCIYLCRYLLFLSIWPRRVLVLPPNIFHKCRDKPHVVLYSLYRRASYNAVFASFFDTPEFSVCAYLLLVVLCCFSVLLVRDVTVFHPASHSADTYFIHGGCVLLVIKSFKDLFEVFGQRNFSSLHSSFSCVSSSTKLADFFAMTCAILFCAVEA